MTESAPVIILPGLSELLAPGTYQRVAEAAGIERVQVVDLAGLVATAGADPDVECVADALLGSMRDVEAPVDIVAEGPAATVALRLAVESASLVRSVVLVAPAGFPRPLTPPIELGPRLDDVFDALAAGDDLAAIQQLCAPGHRAEIAARTAARPDPAGIDVLRRWWASGAVDGVHDGQRQQELRSVRQPVQLVWGRDDAVAGLDSGFFLLRRLRSVQLRVVPFCGHLVALEAEALLAQVIGTFVRVSHEPEHLAPAGTG